MPPSHEHECLNPAAIANANSAYAEIVEGRNNRRSLLVRMETTELQIANLLTITNRVAYIATALLLAVILAAGTILWQTVTASLRHDPAKVALFK